MIHQRPELCAQSTVNPDWWTSDLAEERSYAAHLCTRHCRVLAACFRYAQDHAEDHQGTVVGGLLWGRTRGEGVKGQVLGYSYPDQWRMRCPGCAVHPVDLYEEPALQKPQFPLRRSGRTPKLAS